MMASWVLKMMRCRSKRPRVTKAKTVYVIDSWVRVRVRVRVRGRIRVGGRVRGRVKGRGGVEG